MEDEPKRRSPQTLMAMAKRLGAHKLRKMISEGTGRFNEKQIRLFRTLLGLVSKSEKKAA